MRIQWIEDDGGNEFTLKIDHAFFGVVRNAGRIVPQDGPWTWRKFYDCNGEALTLEAAKRALLDACGVK